MNKRIKKQTVESLVDDIQQAPVLQVKHYGIIRSIDVSILKVSPIAGCGIYSVLFHCNKYAGLIFETSVYEMTVFMLQEVSFYHVGMELEFLPHCDKVAYKIPKNREMLSATNPFGEPVFYDSLSLSNHEFDLVPLFGSEMKLENRSRVKKPLLTGINVIDGLFPIACGQRVVIIGTKSTNKTRIALTIPRNHYVNKMGSDTMFIYTGIAVKKRELDIIMSQVLSDKNMICICSHADDPIAMHFLTPFAAVAVAEQLIKDGKYKNIIILHDDLTSHANAYREMCLIWGKRPGREYYPISIFTLHAEIFERAAAFKDGTSITAIGIIYAAEEGHLGLLQTNAISIVDGQIVTVSSSELQPGIDIGTSVSRVGAEAQFTALRGLAAQCKRDIANYLSIKSLYELLGEGASLDSTTATIVIKAKLWISLFNQNIFRDTGIHMIQQYLSFVILSRFPDELIAVLDLSLQNIESKYKEINNLINNIFLNIPVAKLEMLKSYVINNDLNALEAYLHPIILSNLKI